MKSCFWFKPSLARKIGSHMVLLALASIVVLTYLYTQREREYSQVELRKQAEVTLDIISLSIRDELYRLKIDELQELAIKLKENPQITLFVIYDRHGKTLVDLYGNSASILSATSFAGTSLLTLPDGKTQHQLMGRQLVTGQAIWIKQNVIGAIVIGFSTDKMNAKITEITQQSVLLALIFILIATTLTFLMARQITQPLRELGKAASAMTKGNLRIRAQVPPADTEIRLLATTFNEMAEAIQERERALREQADGLEKTVNERTAELQEQARILEEMAATDPLTQAYNRRQFYKIAELEMNCARQSKQPLSVIVMDADHFKRINDTYGHQAGDHALITLTEICQHIIRETDIFARYGGEEFVALLPSTDIHAAKQIAERIRQKVEETEIPAGEKKKLRFTLSLGVSTFVGQADLTFDSLLTQADRALYVSKKIGRNRVTHWVEQRLEFD